MQFNKNIKLNYTLWMVNKINALDFKERELLVNMNFRQSSSVPVSSPRELTRARTRP